MANLICDRPWLINPTPNSTTIPAKDVNSMTTKAFKFFGQYVKHVCDFHTVIPRTSARMSSFFCAPHWNYCIKKSRALPLTTGTHCVLNQYKQTEFRHQTMNIKAPTTAVFWAEHCEDAPKTIQTPPATIAFILPAPNEDSEIIKWDSRLCKFVIRYEWT
jgi:hypothetical protein